MTTNRSINLIAMVFTFAAVIATAPAPANAEGWELRTTRNAVPGTREIEAGDVAEAIKISMIRLPHASPRNKVAVLTNLCIAHIITREFTKAETYCDQAVAGPYENAVSYNNRGVLHALRGDLESAMHDFAAASEAGCVGACSKSSNVPRDLPRPIARRNFDKADHLVRQSRAADETSVATRRN